MIRVPIQRSTGKLLDYQTPPPSRDETYIKNAVAAGYEPDDIEVREVTEQELEELEETRDEPIQQKKRQRETERELLAQSAHQKLIALGLTKEELKALFRIVVE